MLVLWSVCGNCIFIKSKERRRTQNVAKWLCNNAKMLVFLPFSFYHLFVSDVLFRYIIEAKKKKQKLVIIKLKCTMYDTYTLQNLIFNTIFILKWKSWSTVWSTLCTKSKYKHFILISRLYNGSKSSMVCSLSERLG